MKKQKNKNVAVVLSMFETGLGVGRALGRKGIKVYGFDFKKDSGFYSRYIDARLCPDPLDEMIDFIQFLIDFSENFESKPVLFIAADNFLLSVSRNREKLVKYYLFNLPSKQVIESISNKYEQFILAEKAGIPVPKTYFPEKISDLNSLSTLLQYPVFVKALDVNIWRKNISGTQKGFVINNGEELYDRFREIFNRNCTAIIQEIVVGDDTSNHKVCLYVNANEEVLAGFTLFKVRQDPIHFGVGSCVESRYDEELMNLGFELFKKIGYLGVGSAEFKKDVRTGQYKLIELNPRYWQQNSLTEKCGLDFAFINYLDLTGSKQTPSFTFKDGIKWINIYMDFNSFLGYRKEKTLKFGNWLKSLRGPKIFSDYALDDLMPGLYEIKFGLKIFNLPKYIIFKIINK